MGASGRQVRQLLPREVDGVTTLEVTLPGNPDSQFFQVKFGESREYG